MIQDPGIQDPRSSDSSRSRARIFSWTSSGSCDCSSSLVPGFVLGQRSLYAGPKGTSEDKNYATVLSSLGVVSLFSGHDLFLASVRCALVQ